MKKFISGVLVGGLIAVGGVSYAGDRWDNPYQYNVGQVGRTLDETNEKLDLIYGKLKSIDEYLRLIELHSK